VDVNLFAYNGAATVGAAIESVLAQTWNHLSLTLIDDGSDDGTAEVCARYARADARVRVLRHRVNGGAVAAFQRAFWLGEADYVLPKSGDDMLAPDFIQEIMAVLLAHPDTVMCHAQGLIFASSGDVRGAYPAEHSLMAIDADPVARASHVMARYTSSPSFWGIYRRDAVDRLARIRYRAGWDHALLAELALYGEIRHVAAPLYWRRDGGKPVSVLARAATERGSRGLAVTHPMTEPHWHMPLLTTALAHLETFSVARVPEEVRAAAMHAAIDIFCGRWLPYLRREAAVLPALVAACERDNDPSLPGSWSRRGLVDLLLAARMILPEEADLADLLARLVAPPSIQRVAA
jgi:hypothetical protein